MIQLYRAAYSLNVERVALALCFKGLDDQLESQWMTYEDRSAVVAASGQGLVPVIDHDGVVVADSLRILRHLERAVPEPALWPESPARSAELDVFLDWFDRAWKTPPNAIEAEEGIGDPDAGAIARWAGLMDERMDVFESLLAGRDHLLGQFSAADCAAYPFLKYAAGRDPADPDRFHHVLDERLSVKGRPALSAWIERMAQRPSC